MNEKTRLYIFAKSEIALIFLFGLLIALTSFVLGVKVGRSYASSNSPHPLDHKQVELFSKKEEKVNKITEQKPPALQEDELNKRLEETIRAQFAREKKQKANRTQASLPPLKSTPSKANTPFKWAPTGPSKKPKPLPKALKCEATAPLSKKSPSLAEGRGTGSASGPLTPLPKRRNS